MNRASGERRERTSPRSLTSRRALVAGLGGAIASIAGCSGPRVEIGTDGGTTDAAPGFPGPPETVAYPHVRPDGNRVVGGIGAVPHVDPVDIPLESIEPPVWVVGVPGDSGSRWVAVDAAGHSSAVRLVEGRTTEITVDPPRLPAGTPPVLGVVNGRLSLWNPPADAATHAVPAILDSGGSAYVDGSGRLVVTAPGGRTTRADVAALPDTRVLSNNEGQVALLTGPTGRYGHGVLGDSTEAGRLTTALVDRGAVTVEDTVPVASPAVIEGVAPIWADLTGSGHRDLIVTVSDSQVGARLVAYIDGTRTTLRGPPIGGGNRWRHQLAVAPFSPNGRPEAAVVRTPHIGGQVEFYRATGDGLAIEATLDGYSTHVIGSRNLDGALAVDADGDGRLELLVPDQPRRRLAGVRRTAAGATEAWKVPIGGPIVSNLAAVSRTDGAVDIAVARSDGRLRVWPGRSR